jgi:hypothetical protein
MEWTVITVLIALVGLFMTVGKPIIKLNETIAKLTIICNNLDKRFEKFEVDNHDSHKRLWEHSTEQDRLLEEHDKRITVLEKR